MSLRVHGPRLTAIGGGKGGTGKTFIAVNLAHALAREGERILLCDADLGLSNSAVHLGVRHEGDFAALIAAKCSLRDAVTRVDADERASFDLLAAPSGSMALTDETTARRLLKILEAADRYDRVLIDLAAGIQANVMTLAARADETLLVMTPDPASLTDAYAFAKILLRRGAGQAPSVVVNMAAGTSEAKRAFTALEASARAFLKSAPDYLGFVPLDGHATHAIRFQTPLLTLFPQSAATKAIEDIARTLHIRACPATGRVVTIR